jgi:hypothetical protein
MAIAAGLAGMASRFPLLLIMPRVDGVCVWLGSSRRRSHCCVVGLRRTLCAHARLDPHLAHALRSLTLTSSPLLSPLCLQIPGDHTVWIVIGFLVSGTPHPSSPHHCLSAPQVSLLLCVCARTRTHDTFSAFGVLSGGEREQREVHGTQLWLCVDVAV